MGICSERSLHRTNIILMELISSRNFKMKYFLVLLKIRDKFGKAWSNGSERRFYDGHNRKVDGSTPTQASLLRP